MHDPQAVRRGGFTLIETVIVIVLLSMTAAVAIPALTSREPARPEAATADEIVRVVSAARREAIHRAEPMSVRIDPSTGRYWVNALSNVRNAEPNGLLRMEAGIKLEVQGELAHYGFNPDGSAIGDPIAVIGGDRRYIVFVEPWTGEVNVVTH